MRVVVGAVIALVLTVGSATGASAQEDPYTGVLSVSLERAQMSGCRDSGNVVEATGFQPGAEVTFTLDLGSAGVVTFTDTAVSTSAADGGLEGRATADPDGVATASFRMPVDVEAGTYDLEASGINEQGSQDSIVIELRVLACDDGPTPPGGTDPGGTDPGGSGPGDDDLARTGADLSGVARGALVLLALGLALVVAVRTRSTRSA